MPILYSLFEMSCILFVKAKCNNKEHFHWFGPEYVLAKERLHRLEGEGTSPSVCKNFEESRGLAAFDFFIGLQFDPSLHPNENFHE